MRGNPCGSLWAWRQRVPPAAAASASIGFAMLRGLRPPPGSELAEDRTRRKADRRACAHGSGAPRGSGHPRRRA
jgi:hypothetical protein